MLPSVSKVLWLQFNVKSALVKTINSFGPKLPFSCSLFRGSSSVLFDYLFLLLFGQIGNIYKVEQDSGIFFLKGHSRAFI